VSSEHKRQANEKVLKAEKNNIKRQGYLRKKNKGNKQR
jgi:hypothetical protein